MGECARLPRVEGVDGEVHPAGQHVGRLLHLCLLGVGDGAARASTQCGDNLTRENLMKQAASMKDLAVPICCCRASRSTPARPTSIPSSRSSSPASTARPGSCSATCCRTRAASQTRTAGLLPAHALPDRRLPAGSSCMMPAGSRRSGDGDHERRRQTAVRVWLKARTPRA